METENVSKVPRHIVERCRHLQSVIGATPVVQVKQFSNWAGTQLRIVIAVEPHTVEEVQRVILGARSLGLRVRAVSRGYSWSPIFTDNGHVMIMTQSLRRPDGPPMELNQDPDDANCTMLTAAGYIKTSELRDFQISCGVEIESNVILLDVTVSGIVATSCHGTGKNVKSISDEVTRIRLIDSFGNFRTFVYKQDPEMMNAVRGSLGLFGIIVDVTFRVRPRAFVVADDVWVPVRNMLDPNFLKRLLSQNESVEIFWFPMNNVSKGKATKALFTKKLGFNDWDPGNDKLWVRTFSDPHEVSKLADEKYNERVVPVSESLFKFGRKLAQNAPAFGPLFMLIGGNRLMDAYNKPLVQSLPYAIHFLKGIEKLKVWQTEFAFDVGEDFCNLIWAFSELVNITRELAAKGKYPLNNVGEIRFTKGSDVYLAPASASNPSFGGQTGITAHIEIVSIEGTPDWFEYATIVSERWMQIPGARPHWAKLWSYLPAIDDHLRMVYGPNIQKFLELLAKSGADPDRMFFNKRFEELFFPKGLNQSVGFNAISSPPPTPAVPTSAQSMPIFYTVPAAQLQPYFNPGVQSPNIFLQPP